jgi:mitochondrial fission protein ELM1
MKRVVWIISEGSPGHVSQSEGLVAALAAHIDLEKQVIETRPKFGGLMRMWVRRWMGPEGRGLSDRFLKKWLGCDFPTTRPDLIITSGGKAVFASRSLAVKTGAPLVFIGERKPYPSEWFHTVLTPSPFETGVNDVPIEMIPTGMTPESVKSAAISWQERPDGELWAMIIGGASASHNFTDADWQSLGSQMNVLAEKHGIRWLVSTSRRTGARAEGLIKRALDLNHVARAVWWAEKPEKKMAAFFGSAARVFVTQDSVTMVTEAVAAGQPVLVLRPEKTAFATDSFLPGYFKNLENRKRIVRVMISELADFDPGAWSFEAKLVPIETELATLLLERRAISI